MFKGQETEEEDKKAPDRGRQAWGVFVYVCVCMGMGVCTYTEACTLEQRAAG